MSNLTFLNLTKHDYFLLKRAVKSNFRRFRLNDEDIDDVIQDGILSIMLMYRPIIESTKIGFILNSIKYVLLNKYNKKMTEIKYYPFLLNEFKLQQETAQTQFELVLNKELSTYQIVLPKKTILEKKLKTSGNKPVIREDGLCFNSAREAARYMKVGKSSISNAIKNKWRCGGFMWKYND